jgi:hypothetical protein
MPPSSCAHNGVASGGVSVFNRPGRSARALNGAGAAVPEMERMTDLPDKIPPQKRESPPGGARERNERLAEALRRNLVKRKDKKPANPEGKSISD